MYILETASEHICPSGGSQILHAPDERCISYFKGRKFCLDEQSLIVYFKLDAHFTCGLVSLKMLLSHHSRCLFRSCDAVSIWRMSKHCARYDIDFYQVDENFILCDLNWAVDEDFNRLLVCQIHTVGGKAFLCPHLDSECVFPMKVRNSYGDLGIIWPQRH